MKYFSLIVFLFTSVSWGQGCDAKNQSRLMNPSRPSDAHKMEFQHLRKLYPPSPEWEKYQADLATRHRLLMQKRLHAQQRRSQWQYKWQYQSNYPYGPMHWRYQLQYRPRTYVYPRYNRPQYDYRYRYDYRY